MNQELSPAAVQARIESCLSILQQQQTALQQTMTELNLLLKQVVIDPL